MGFFAASGSAYLFERGINGLQCTAPLVVETFRFFHYAVGSPASFDITHHTPAQISSPPATQDWLQLSFYPLQALLAHVLECDIEDVLVGPRCGGPARPRYHDPSSDHLPG